MRKELKNLFDNGEVKPLDVRDAKQDAIVDAVVEKLNKTFRCSVISGTGTGKSYIAMKLIKRLKPSKVLILVNSLALKNINWKVEFEGFGLGEFYEKNVISETYQFMYKQDLGIFNLPKDALIFLDEVDFIANTAKLERAAYLHPSIKTVGLTGYVTESKLDWFDANMPIIEHYSAHQAQTDGLLNNVRYTFIKFTLSNNPNYITVEYKSKDGSSKSFTQSESSAYLYWDKEFKKAIIGLRYLEKEIAEGKIDFGEYSIKKSKLEWKLKKANGEMVSILHTCEMSKRISENLIKHIQSIDSKAKILVFSKRTSQSDAICGVENSYHGKNPNGAEVYDDFRTSDNGGLMCACDKVNRGANISGLKYGIMESYNGSDTQFKQKSGRFMRLAPDDLAEVFILLPYINVPVKNPNHDPLDLMSKPTIIASKETKAVGWARDMMMTTEVKQERLWDYRTVKD